MCHKVCGLHGQASEMMLAEEGAAHSGLSNIIYVSASACVSLHNFVKCFHKYLFVRALCVLRGVSIPFGNWGRRMQDRHPLAHTTLCSGPSGTHYSFPETQTGVRSTEGITATPRMQTLLQHMITASKVKVSLKKTNHHVASAPPACAQLG